MLLSSSPYRKITLLCVNGHCHGILTGSSILCCQFALVLMLCQDKEGLIIKDVADFENSLFYYSTCGVACRGTHTALSVAACMSFIFFLPFCRC